MRARNLLVTWLRKYDQDHKKINYAG
jgi:hypothetical protein